MAEQLQGILSELEKRVADRTKALETSAEISRRLASILDPRELTAAVVNEIRNAYNYYYAQIYLFDDAGENLVLTAGTGEAGAAMMKRGHSLAKGRGLVGRAADTKETILVSDTSQDPNWLPNDLLPDTKAEAAVPITIGGHVLGVLDVQDDVTNDINPGDITLLESLANQVAVSLNNARQYQQAQSLREQYTLAVESSNDGIWDWDIANDNIFYSPRWKAMLGYEEHELTRGFVEWEELIHPEDRDYATKALEDYLAQRAPVYDVEIRLKHKDGTWRWIRDRGKALRRPDGSAYRMAGSHSDFTERKQQEALTAQRARQQEAINTITQKIQSATTIEEAMQVAARELGHALGMKATMLKLEAQATPNKTESAS
jgi:PAS domain S-box-containing protein